MENTSPPPATSSDILDEKDYVELCQAGSGKRLVNYFVDYGIAYLLFRFVVTKLLVTFLATIVYTKMGGSTVSLYLVSYLMALTWYVLFRTAFEGLTGGKSIGKYLTRTRAVNNDGTRITAKTALLRSLARSIPFEAFSALGGDPPYPWHDRWTRTYVIDEAQSSLAIS